MNYEELYDSLLVIQKEMSDKAALSQRLVKKVTKATAGGDLKAARKDVLALEEAVSHEQEALSSFRQLVDNFDSEAYFSSGDIERQIVACCQEMAVDVSGAEGVYEMFPYKIRVDVENQDLYMDRKKVSCMRPSAFVTLVKNGIEKMDKVKFNPDPFAQELSEAYDLLLLKLGKRPGTDLFLLDLYKILAPMSRYRKEYDKQSFAYDIARLRRSELEATKNGRRFQFGPSRKANKGIRILDGKGREEFLATIQFF